MINQKIIKICEQKLIYLNYAENTRNTYLFYIEQFVESRVDKQIIHSNSKDFQSYLDNYSFSSISQQNQVINAIRFLYKYGLEKKYDKVSFERPRGEKKLPRIIEKDFLLKQIDKISNLKHKAIISLSYSTGMRVSEILNLRIIDIDSKRMVVNVLSSKGRKDRLVPLSPKILELLRKYYLQFKPNTYLFNGQNSLQYSEESCSELPTHAIGDGMGFGGHRLT